MFELVEDIQQGAKIKVVGVGGAGGNAINTMIASALDGVDFIAANTDLQALKENLAETQIQLGRNLTKGLGAGANPEIGRNAAIETERELADALMGADMIFVTAGMGGGTGTGAAPIVAKVAKECGALTVGVVTKPFEFEGKRRMLLAEEGINNLRDAVDTLITIPNEKLLTIAGQDTTVVDTFKMADDVLLQATRGIANLITVHGLINLDFADVRAVMSEMGMALMGSGIGSGENRAVDAATKAISSPLLENLSIRGATGLLINVTGGGDMTLHEVNEASKLIQEEAEDDANIIFGAVIDPALEDEVRVTVIATGFNRARRHGRERDQPVRAGTSVTTAATPRSRFTQSLEQRAEERYEPVVETRYETSYQPQFSRFEQSVDGGYHATPEPTVVTQQVVSEPVPAPAPAAPSTAPQSAATRGSSDWGSMWDGTQREAGGSVPTQRNYDDGVTAQSADTRPVGATVRQPYVPENDVNASGQNLQDVMAEVGVSTDQREDQYDIPTFLRKQAD